MSDPQNMVAPALTYPKPAGGTYAPMVGQVITCDGGTWKTYSPPIGLQYYWYRGAAQIAGENPGAPTHLATAADIGSTIKCSVDAYNALGPNTSAFSNTTLAVTDATGNPTENVVIPSISAVNIGVPTTCDPGTWIGQLPITFAYQWEEYVSSVWTKIVGAVSASYTPVAADAGATIRCVVLATNALGSTACASVGTVVGNAATIALTAPVASMQRQHRGPKWFRDLDGIWDAEKQFEGTETDVQDWSDALGGETITSIVVATDGIIINSSSNTDTITTVTVTGVGAYHIDITTSAGRMVREYFRYRRLHRPLLGIMDGGGGIDADYR